MKKLHKLLIVAGVSLAVCVCIAVAVFIRLSWCKVTFVCIDGCEHTIWQRKGEVADLTPVYEAHGFEKDEIEILGIYQDEERLLYYFEEELSTPSKTYHLGLVAHPFMASKAYFDTQYGEIVIYFLLANSEERNKAFEEQFLAAYEKLGGDPQADLVFVMRSNYNYTWSSTEDFSDVCEKMNSKTLTGMPVGGPRLVPVEKEIIFVVEIPAKDNP